MGYINFMDANGNVLSLVDGDLKQVVDDIGSDPRKPLPRESATLVTEDQKKAEAFGR